MTRRAINLVFYCYPKKGTVDDFREVSRRIAATTPEIATHVYTTDANLRALLGTFGKALRPTLTIEMDRVRFAWPLRGRRFSHRHGLGKPDELRRLGEAGLPVPEWTELTPATRLDPAKWGRYVVVKPAFSRRGAYVWIRKTGKVRYEAPSDFPKDHPGHRAGMYAQRFIYTGEWPIAYRVSVYFGKPIVAVRYEGRRDLPPLQDRDAFRGTGGRSIVANAMGCTISCIDDADILDLARRAHLSFPETPSLGVDIVREEGTGKLYILEVNPGGGSWMLSTGGGRKMQEQFGLDFYAQFGALDIIAKVSADLALRLAQ